MFFFNLLRRTTANNFVAAFQAGRKQDGSPEILRQLQ